MDPTTTATFRSFLGTLNAIERSALLDVLSSYTEDVEVAPDVDPPAHHEFLRGLQGLVEDAIVEGGA